MSLTFDLTSINPLAIRRCPLHAWRVRFWLLLSLAALGCSDAGGDDAPGSAGAGGSAALALAVHPANFIQESEPMRMLSNGDPVELVAALQGGFVIYVGAQVENFRSTQGEIVAQLYDPTTSALRREDTRTIVMKPIDGQPGWKQPDLRSRSQVAHLVVCPNEEPTDVFGQPFRLELRMTEVADGSFKGAPRSGSASLTVTPRCADLDANQKARCSCECEANYTIGKCSSP